RRPGGGALGSAAMAGPFSHRSFTVLWCATVASNVGTWMHDVGAGWLMTELSPSPFLVASVQAATTLPVFLLALFAGAIADLVDRRRLLISINVGLGGAAVFFALLVHLGLVTPPILLGFTLIFGTGAAFIAPAWQAIVPSLVPRSELASAVALNSMGINVSRAIGPALAGFLIVAAGLAFPFAVNALSFVGIIAALLWWKPPARGQEALEREHIGGAIRAGLHYVAFSPPFRATLLRAICFFLFASCFWAMLPLIARVVLDGGPSLYGLLMAAVGAGAVVGALLIPRLKKLLGADGMVTAGTLGMVGTLGVTALGVSQALAVASSLIAGFAWIMVLSTLNVAAQTALPDWVRARGLSIYLTVFFGAMTAGSLIWGQVASKTTIPVALLAAGGLGLALLVVAMKAPLAKSDGSALAPSMHWPEPVLVAEGEPDGPVVVWVEYEVPAENADAFHVLMQQLAKSRRRLGGYQWQLLRDAATPNRCLESWREVSWLDHRRHHRRVSVEDQQLQDRIAELLAADTRPVVRHFVG
ncbi:MAG: MFS transporter, partial [Acidobacteriota bacterium]